MKGILEVCFFFYKIGLQSALLQRLKAPKLLLLKTFRQFFFHVKLVFFFFFSLLYSPVEGGEWL